jgi:hypothetical protein
MDLREFVGCENVGGDFVKFVYSGGFAVKTSVLEIGIILVAVVAVAVAVVVAILTLNVQIHRYMIVYNIANSVLTYW